MTESFGRRALTVTDSTALLDLEAETGRAERFAELDSTLGQLLVAAFRGDEIVTSTRRRGSDQLALNGLDTRQRDFIRDCFSLDSQQGRGAWYLPEKVRVRTGRVNFLSAYRRSPRFGASLIAGDGATVEGAKSPDAIFAWSILDPLFETLFLPIELRLSLGKSRDDQLKAWASFDRLLAALRLDLDDELAPMRYGGGWSRLSAAEKTEARIRLFDALEAQASVELACRYRAFRVQSLIERFYKRAAKGTPTRRQVLTRAEERTLSGFFGGDWLAFLDYLDEAPAAGEEIVPVLPEPRLFAGGGEKIDRVAASENLPVAEVERILAALWNQSEATSPIAARVTTLRQFWRAFDELHARQAPGMESLWGLTEEGPLLPHGDERDTPFSRGLCRRKLSAELLAEIRDLWGTVVLPRWPDRIVSSLSPIETMAAALGPALRFWHGCALTAWFLCEGPYSRTDMAGLASYHSRDLDALVDLACPIDESLFAELIAAEGRLPAPEPIYDDTMSETLEDPELPFSISVRISTRSRREGFERLRDIITRHRRRWAEEHLESYLRSRWQNDLRYAAREHSRYIAAHGKPPTAKQFTKAVAPATNAWLGGDLAGLYAVIGEKSPVKPERVVLVPDDREAFAHRVFDELGGKPFRIERLVTDREAASRQREESNRYWRTRDLAEKSITYLQLQGALGQAPDRQLFGRRDFDFIANEIWGDAERGWQLYVEAIERARDALDAPLLDAGLPSTAGRDGDVDSQANGSGLNSFIARLRGFAPDW